MASRAETVPLYNIDIKRLTFENYMLKSKYINGVIDIMFFIGFSVIAFLWFFFFVSFTIVSYIGYSINILYTKIFKRNKQ